MKTCVTLVAAHTPSQFTCFDTKNNIKKYSFQAFQLKRTFVRYGLALSMTGTRHKNVKHRHPLKSWYDEAFHIIFEPSFGNYCAAHPKLIKNSMQTILKRRRPARRSFDEILLEHIPNMISLKRRMAWAKKRYSM